MVNFIERQHELISDLAQVKGVKAVVLGGSYARGTAKPDSDIDLGLYYFKELDVSAIRQIVNKWSIKPATVTEPYEWGAWVNGGAWMETAFGKVDLLYRNLEQVAQVVKDSESGKHSCDAAQQPPFGFYSVTYLGEVKTCVPLQDAAGVIKSLKDQVSIYPVLLKESIVQDNLWSVEFTLSTAKKCAKRGDLYSTAGCVTRALACLTQVLFALNETYFISDREAMDQIEKFEIRPNQYKERVLSVLTHLANGIDGLEQLFSDVKAMTNYTPKYAIK